MRTLLAAFTIGVTISAQTESKHTSYSREQQEVLAVDNAIQKAVLAGNVAELDLHWSKDVMFVGGDGRVWNKTERLKDFQSQNRTVAGQRREQENIRVFGDTAIFTSTGWQEGIRDGRAFNSRSHLTRVYLKRGRRWQLFHQSSALLERKQ